MFSIKKNLFHNLLFLLSNLLFPLITFSYISRIIGPEGYGKIQFIIAFTQYFIVIAALGIPIFGVREIAKVRNNKDQLSKLFSELVIIHIIFTIILLSIYLITIFTFNWFNDDINLYLLGGLLVFAGFSTLDWFYNGLEEFKYLSIRSIIVKSISLIALVVFVKTPNDLIPYFLIVIFTIILNNLWNLIKANSFISFTTKKINLYRHLPVLFTLFGTTLSISIYTILDTLLLGFIADEVSVGYYTAALKINKIAIPFITALGVVLIPRITQCIEKNDTIQLQSLFEKSFSYIIFLGIPISFGLFLYAPEFILSVSGEKFSKAILTMQITAPLIVLIGLGHLFGFQLLIPAGLEKKYLNATIIGMIISVILNVLLIHSFKDKGTAVATTTGELFVSLISFYYVIKYFKLKINWTLFFKSVISCILFIPIAYFLRLYDIDVVFRLILAIFFSASTYLFIQFYIFKEPDLKTIIQNALRQKFVQ